MRSAVSQRVAKAFGVLVGSVLALSRLISADFCATPSFAAARNFGAGSYPFSLAVGDFDGDGKLDLVVANLGSTPTHTNDSVSILLGNGDGTFHDAVNHVLGTNLVSVVVSDFNRDHNLDLAALLGNDYWTYGIDSIVLILLGNGNGLFSRGENYDVEWYGSAFGVADLNGDGNPDIVVNGHPEYNGHVLLGNGDGTFADLSYYAGSLSHFLLGDFNSDGKPDLLTIQASAITTRLGNGDGTFQEAITNEFQYAGDVLSETMGDFNRDGKLDVAFAVQNAILVMIGNGNGTFQSPRTYTAGASPLLPKVTDDFNGDGKLDLVVAEYLGGNAATFVLSVLLGVGDGTFERAGSFAVGVAPSSIAVGDFDGDGKPDVAVSDRGLGVVSVLLNTCGSIPPPRLALVRNDTNVIISWLAPTSDFVLQSTTNLVMKNWQPAVAAPVTNATGGLEVSVPLDRFERYFRLRKP
jgi:hypothetical protein